MSFAWTEERLENMRDMFADRLSASQIAERFGVTRNVVCGKLARMGLTRAADQHLSSAPKKPRVPKHEAVGAPAGSLAFKVIHSIKRKQREAEDGGIDPQPFVCRDAADIVPRHLDLLELAEQDCKYPYGDGPITFCGHPRRKGTPYCPGHCAVAFNGIPTRRSQRTENIEAKPYRMGGGHAA
jgi:GcrA cell cycle regulator